MPRIPQKDIVPYWQTLAQGEPNGEMVRLYLGDVVETLRRLPSRSVQMCVTSPPYWGLRDYGTGFWEGGDPKCLHKRDSQKPVDHYSGNGGMGGNTNWDHRHEIGYKGTCGKCGAKQKDNQIGSEATPDLFVAKMVEVFREVRRVLRKDGTMWLNLGSSYSNGIVEDVDEPYALRDNLTPDELKYVLSELAHFSKSGEVSKPD